MCSKATNRLSLLLLVGVFATRFVLAACIAALACIAAVDCSPSARGSSAAGARLPLLDPPTPPLPQSFAVVPAGTEFMAMVETPIDSSTSRSGQAVALRLLGSLRSTDPRTNVADGSRIRGVLTAVTTGYLPTIQIRFTSVDTTAGRVPIYAAIRYAGSTAWVDPHAIYDPEILGYDTILYHAQFRPRLGAGTAIGGGPRPLDDPVTPMSLPAGSEIALVLARPLMLPSP